MNALRIKQVAAKVGLGQSTLYRMIAEGGFPKPFDIAPKRNAWLEEDIDAWLAARAGRQPPAPAARTVADAVAQPLDGESLDELARRIAMRLTPHALWDLIEVAAYLHRSEQHTRQWIVSQDGFPPLIRIPSGKRATEGARLLWRAKDVIAWAESHVAT
ncbi:AlpA family phage regulatory protein [Burkholderia pseudomallei]|uniref:helix-turn-helix transcriptional regulator n=1 Tax=Burkholderia pseudomallei TaxID=28450 RepID=UPI001E637D30|nr:AlpA family phage regulatory protein [Burkholderia pseudomallei]CAJ2828272.1 prophage CP4-57 regulatory protein (AlpA) [Burkholderia pseudomallei]CAJ3125629.1 prophage CP4-57 regulatory protein (AlpA) [Burkholderia pseudomallei]CAJ4640418.1 prophage CP4-57 regulatory protein (AlpA) [Burkholderia pseudomallei]CAJ5047571.1 prophage CP4-57 regulatory protein (AlpA) [Burkholderia pseudomallei]